MFFAVDIIDNIPLECDNAGNTFEETFEKLKEKLRAKYVDHIISNHGLCVSILEIRRMDGMPVLSPNDGRPCYKLQFTAIIFKPVEKEALYGWIAGADATGLRVHTKFFQDIRIPARMLPEGCVYDENLELWCWRTDVTDEFGSKKTSELWLNIESQVRFRVEAVIYGKEDEVVKQELSKDPNADPALSVPMLILGSVVDPGLGLVEWWEG